MIRSLNFPEVASEIAEKAKYWDLYSGGSPDVVPKCMALLYPDGILTSQMTEANLIASILDNLCVLSKGNRCANEFNPWEHVISFALHGHKNYVNAGGNND